MKTHTPYASSSAASSQEPAMHFNLLHERDSQFVHDGLRPYFEYRDLGILEATGGKAVMHVIRAHEGCNATGEWHRHEVQLQIVYVLKGWVKFEYEGHGEHTLVAGTCVHQAPGIRHREIAHSDDMELLEIVLPGNFKTTTD